MTLRSCSTAAPEPWWGASIDRLPRRPELASVRLLAHPVASLRGRGICEPAHLSYLLDAPHGDLVLPRRVGLLHVPPIEQVPDRDVALGRPWIYARRLRRAIVRGRIGRPDRDGFEGVVPREVIERSQEAPRVFLYAAGRHAPTSSTSRTVTMYASRCTLLVARRNRPLLTASSSGGTTVYRGVSVT